MKQADRRVIIMCMEWPRLKQIEILWPKLWPKKMSPEELQEELDKKNDELRKAGNYGKRKGEDLISKEETTKAVEVKGAGPEKILSPKESAKKAREVLEKLKGEEKKKNGKSMQKKKS